MMKNLLLTVTLFVISLPLLSQDKPADWADFGRYAEANKTITVAPKAVFMGNSITDGWWNMDSLFFKSNNYVDRGISGQVTSQMLVRFRSDVIDLKPEIVVILAGTNDIAQNMGYISLENIFGNIVSMAELAKMNKIKVVICSVLPVSLYPWRKDIVEPAKIIKNLNSMLKSYAEQSDCYYVDYHTPMSDENGGLPKLLSNDGVHPKKAGYNQMKQIVQATLNNIK